jgi:hypothetical protein
LSDKDADKLIAGIWKAFKGTEAHQLLEINLYNAATTAESVVSNPGATSEQRTFFAGQLALARNFQRTLQAAFEFDPAKAVYEEPPQDDADDSELDPQFKVIN